MVSLHPAPPSLHQEPTLPARHPHVLHSVAGSAPPDLHTWLAEHERTLQRLRTRVAELEQGVERTQDLAIPNTIAVATLAALPLIACLPWLHGSGATITGWALLLATLGDPMSASAIYAVLAALIMQSLALMVKNRICALLAAIGSGLACVTLASFILSSARSATYDPASGPMVGVAVLLSACVAWSTITAIIRE